MAKNYLELIDNDAGGTRNDLTPLWVGGFAQLMDDMTTIIPDADFTHIAGIESYGFIVGAGLAARFGVGFIPIRKAGKLEVLTATESCLDYTGQTKTLEIRADTVKAGDRVLIVDDWIETGGQMRAAIKLVEKQGGHVVGMAVVHADHSPENADLREQYRIFALETNE